MTSSFFNCKTALTAIASACLLSACGGSSSGSFGDQPQEKTTSAYSGSVIDGYVSDATVCIDSNANNVCDANEAFAKTNQLGAYSVLPTASGNLVAVGGTNKDTMKPNELILLAPGRLIAGSSNLRQITPLTTMAVLAARDTESSDESKANIVLAGLIKQRFKLDGNFDLFRFDPIARAINSTLTEVERKSALSVHSLGVQVANTVLTSIALDGDKSVAGQKKKFIAVLALVAGNEDPDLTKESQLRKVLFAGSDIEPSAAQVKRLAESNARVLAAASPTAIGQEQNSYLNALATNPNPGGDTTPPDNGGGDGDGDGGTGDNGGFNPADFLSPKVLCNIPVLGPILVNNVLALVLAPIPVPGFEDLACDESAGGGFELPGIPGAPDSGGAPSLPGLPGADAGGSPLAPLTSGLGAGLCLIPVLGPEIINGLGALPIPGLEFEACPEGEGGGFEFPGIG